MGQDGLGEPEHRGEFRLAARAIGPVGQRVHDGLDGVDRHLVTHRPDRHADQAVGDRGQEGRVRRSQRRGLDAGQVGEDRGHELAGAFDRDRPEASALAVERGKCFEPSPRPVDGPARSAAAATARGRSPDRRASSSAVATWPSSPNAIFLISMRKMIGRGSRTRPLVKGARRILL